MVIVRLRGDLGNQMCQYSVGRIIAEHKKYSLKLDESDDGWKNVLHENFPNTTIPNGAEVTTNPISIGPNLYHLEYDVLFNHSGLIFLHGYWQKHYLFTPYESRIKEWFSYDDTAHEKPDADDIVIHCRFPTSALDHTIISPITTFIDIVNTLNYRKCVVVTDRPDNPMLDQFKCLNNVVIRSKSRMEDFTFLKHARRLIISQSSFSWWASFLGNQEKVYVPLTFADEPIYWKAKPGQEDTEFIPTNDKYVKFYI